MQTVVIASLMVVVVLGQGWGLVEGGLCCWLLGKLTSPPFPSVSVKNTCWWENVLLSPGEVPESLLPAE